ncbi:cytochrome P450 [Streptomyces malaysiensis subsp. malaysiensis]|uniref:Cytochrome P450 n=1 Tax=Streptomyces malaysiensis TaxID=92644 RepID=A0ABX6W3W1_STRMQ|nr:MULTISPECIES: cytochrome P450 [Streptomyces]QPI56185.1 cytochrome P450 [Streptomyces solisilvae]UHH17655.1 cytochrome P450 [Streptomyces sp. HNM0561]
MPGLPEGHLPQPFDAAFLDNPYPGYAQLRDESAVHQVALPDGSPIWLVLREEDVRAGLTDPRLSVNKAHSGTGYKGFSLPPALDANLLNIDPEDHQRLRRLVSKAFTARRVENLRGSVRAAVDRLADELAGQGGGDLVSTFSLPLPLMVIGDLLAVPEADRRHFSTWVSNMLTPESPRQIKEAVENIHTFLLDLVAARRDALGDDMLSALIAVRDEDDQLTENELVSLAFLLLMAGSENAQHLISAGLVTLLQHPEQVAELRADPGLLPEAVEELLRYAHPNQMAIRRFPTEPIEIGGTQIPAGATVMLCLASAHRDPKRYPSPDEFDIHREDKAHLALGQGMHYCLGAPLARMEIQIALHTLLHRFPQLDLAVPPQQLQWRTSFRSRALKAVPVTLR